MAIQGFEPRGTTAGDLTQALMDFIVSNGVVVTAGNAVTLISGYVENQEKAVGRAGILGVAASTVTGTSASATVGVYCDPNITFYNDADGSLAQADIGNIYNTVITSGKMYIDQSTGTSAIASTSLPFVLVKKDPDGDQDASKGLFKIYNSVLANGESK